MDHELILLEDVADLGKIGTVVKVKPGFARNYLIPRGLATKATAGAMRQLEVKKKRLRVEYEKAMGEARKLAEDIARVQIVMPVQAGDDDKLYGSVNAHQIAQALAENNVVVDRRKIDLAEPIKTIGAHQISILLHPEVTATVKVFVTKA
jgi:large subunit ribosomal protein L9